jgi:hypothetical protein
MFQTAPRARVPLGTWGNATTTVASIYTLPFVPTLLQTTEYAQVTFQNTEDRSEDQVSQLLGVRERRQRAQGCISKRQHVAARRAFVSLPCAGWPRRYLAVTAINRRTGTACHNLFGA